MILIRPEQTVTVLDEIPNGYKKVLYTMTQPIGCSWYSNGKSIFSGERKSVLVCENKELFLSQYGTPKNMHNSTVIL